MSVTLKQGESVSLTTGKVEKALTAPEHHDPEIRAYYRTELTANNLTAVPAAIYLYGEH